MNQITNEDMKSSRGIIYVRVSSEEQVSGTSLDFQVEECTKFCHKNNIEVVKVFREEGASAKSSNRKEFLRAIDFCKRELKHEKPINSFVVLKCDRFARNVEDHFLVRRTLSEYQTNLISVTEPIDDSPAGRVFEAMLSAFAEFDNSIRRQRSIDGMSAKINEGIIPWHPPIGYQPNGMKRSGKKKNMPDSIDHALFPIIQRGLKHYAAGKYKTMEQLRRDLDAWGLAKIRGVKTYKQLIFKMLTVNLPFYAGILFNPFTKKTVEGVHTPMITKEEMMLIQIRLKRNRNQPGSKAVFRDDFPLRQFIRCSCCKNGLTGGITKGSSKKYHYYRCDTKDCHYYGKSIPKALLEGEFQNHLEKIIPTPRYWNLLKNRCMLEWKTQKNQHQIVRGKYQSKLEKLEKKKERLKEAYLEGVIDSKEEYISRKEKIENEILSNKISVNETSLEVLDLEALINTAETYMNSIIPMWEDLVTPDKRNQFLRFVFDGGVFYSHKERTLNYKLNYIFKYCKGISGNTNHENQKSSKVFPGRLTLNLLIQNLSVVSIDSG